MERRGPFNNGKEASKLYFFFPDMRYLVCFKIHLSIILTWKNWTFDRSWIWEIILFCTLPLDSTFPSWMFVIFWIKIQESPKTWRLWNLSYFINSIPCIKGAHCAWLFVLFSSPCALREDLLSSKVKYDPPKPSCPEVGYPSNKWWTTLKKICFKKLVLKKT